MTALTARERGDLAERMLPLAAQLANVVHGDGGQYDVGRLLDGLDRQELLGLVVVLAALVDPEQQLAEALAYVLWDEHGERAGTAPVSGSIRQAARPSWAVGAVAS